MYTRNNNKGVIRDIFTEDTTKGTDLLNKYIDTAIENSRGNSRQLPCLARTKVLTLVFLRTVYMDGGN